MTLGAEVVVREEWTALPDASRATALLVRLTVAMTLAMTAFAVLTPVVPRRLAEVGAGVQALGLLLGVAALAQFVAAPVMGALADRLGRRPVLLAAFAAYVAVAVVFLAAEALGPYLAVRAAEGVLTAGLFPATVAVVSDVMPATRRTRWIGIVTAAYAIGFVVGPLAGGAAYDAGGSAVAFGLAAVLALGGLLVTSTVPETQRRRRRTGGGRAGRRLPSPTVRVLLAVDFLVLFAFGFIAPQLVFFAYDKAGLTTTQYGVVVAGSALAMAAAQTLLSGLSDRWDRRAVIVGALTVYAATFPLYVPFHSPTAIVLIAAAAGFAFGVLSPALTAAYLATADDAERSTVLGVRNAVMSAGAFAGPLLLAVVRAWVSPEIVFVATGLGLLAPAVVALVALPPVASTVSTERAQVAGAAVIGVVALARAADAGPHASAVAGNSGGIARADQAGSPPR